MSGFLRVRSMYVRTLRFLTISEHPLVFSVEMLSAMSALITTGLINVIRIKSFYQESDPLELGF